MKVKIDIDEWYPVYEISSDKYDWGRTCEMSEEDRSECSRVFVAFDNWQDKLRELYKSAPQTP